MRRRVSLARAAGAALLVVGALVTRPAWSQDAPAGRAPAVVDSGAAPAPAGADSIAAPLPAPTPDAAGPGVIAASDSVAPPVSDFAGYLSAFLAQRADSTHVATVSRLVLERDAGRFVLENGTVWLATPVGGRVCMIVYLGGGAFALTPPHPVERDQMKRVYGTTTMDRKFSALVMLVADSTVAELRRNLTFRSGGSSKPANVVLGECLRYVSEPKKRTIKSSLAKPFLEGRANGYFFSLIESVGAERLFFEIDPLAVEEVMLWREPKARHLGLWRVWRRNDVCMFARQGPRDPPPLGDSRPVLSVKHQRIECRISGSMEFSAVAEMELESRAATPQHWASFNLYDQLDVDSVAWEGGGGAERFKGPVSSRFWVRCDPPLAPRETRVLRVRYHGRLIERVGDWMLLRSSTEWYPEPDGRQKAPFDLTFHSPSQYHLVSVGERVSSHTKSRVTTTRWVSERPIHNASFVIGLFDEEPFGGGDPPPVSALMFRGKPDPIQIAFGDIQVVSGARMTRRVATEAARAAEFFNRVLGPPPTPRVIVAEIPDTGGEAFPGLVQLTWTPFVGRNVAAEDAVFRAHEVAHQWWGYGVDYRSYHDNWLSEGFADFSALWYLQEGVGDTRSYLAVLDTWRDEIIEDMSFRPADSPPAGPIWLGYRSASLEAPGDHALIVYKKGAWVLHMLRNLLLDLDTGNEERFAGLMRDFYARHEGQAASTEDFIRIAQRYAGQDLGWFFDQWVYGTEIPTYRFASRTERTPEGRFKVTCRVEQSGVSEGFRMPVPIRIDFAGGRSARVRHVVQGARTEFELPLMEREPEAVVFNDLESVLCRVEPVRW